MDKSSNDLETMAASLSATDSTLQRELDSLKEGAADLASRVTKLREHVAKETPINRLTPALLKLKVNIV